LKAKSCKHLGGIEASRTLNGGAGGGVGWVELGRGSRVRGEGSKCDLPKRVEKNKAKVEEGLRKPEREIQGRGAGFDCGASL